MLIDTNIVMKVMYWGSVVQYSIVVRLFIIKSIIILLVVK